MTFDETETKSETGAKSGNGTEAGSAAANKELIRTCMELYGKGDLDAVAPLMRDDYADHGVPFLTSTKEEWLAVARGLPLAQFRIDIRLLVAEGDYVTMFSRRSLPGGELDIVVADVFRLQDARIAERWEVVEPIPPNGANPVETL